MAIAAGGVVAGQTPLDRLQAGGEPVGLPGAPGRIVEPALGRQILPDARDDERVGVGSQHEGDRADPGTAMRIGRKQRRVGLDLVEELEDGERLGERQLPFLDQRRYRAERVDGQEALAVLLAGREIDDMLLGRQPLQGQRHPHAEGGGRAPEGIQLETRHLG